MADSEQDQFDPALAFSLNPTSAGDSSSQNVLSESATVRAVSDMEEVSQEPIDIHATGTSSHIGNGQSDEPDASSADKGKAPVRCYDNFSGSTQFNDAETSHVSLSPQSHTAEPGITKDTSISGTSDESNEPGTELRDGKYSTASEEPPLTSKQKQKQKAGPEDGSETESAHIVPTSNGPSTSEGTQVPAFRSLQPGEPGWEKTSDRPPKKLPGMYKNTLYFQYHPLFLIRLKDAVGRQYVFPWEKAKTWEGMERLIRSCFMHVDVFGPYVMDGRYDLLTYLPFSDPVIVSQSVVQSSDDSVSVTEASTGTATPSISPQGGATDAPTTGPTSSPTVPQAPTPPPAAPSHPPPPAPAPAPAPVPIQQTHVMILPELWEDTVEPGMTILMQMWPIVPRDWPLDVQPPPPPPPQPQPAAAALPPGPPHHILPGGMPVGWNMGGRGRGRGRGGMGRGMPMPGHGHILPRHIPPGWVVVPSKPKGKTRKKPDNH